MLSVWRGPAKGARGHSLAWQLALWVVLPQLVLWLAAGAATYRFVAGYANDAIDSSLLQASRALARQLKPIGSGLFIDFPRAAQDVLEADPNDRQYYTVSSPPGQFILGNQALPVPPRVEPPGVPPYGEPIFYDAEILPRVGPGVPDGVGGAEPLRVRVAALYLRVGEEAGAARDLLVQVARSSANREQLARRILTDMLLPMSSLVLLMTVVVGFGIRAGLAPLKRLRQQVEGRAPTNLAPLELSAAPRELRSLAAALNALLAAVSRSVSAQRRFIGDAAHQLRTPLAGLKGQTELALDAAPAGSELRARLERVHRSAVRSAHLVNQLLTLARAEPEVTGVQDQQRLDLRELARALTAECVPRALQAGIDLGMDEAEHAPVHVEVNRLLMREAVFNLIDNALRYAGPGAEVTVRVGQTDGWAQLAVIDTGPGIEVGDRERVFERFVRATSAGEGCGLGLAIVREIVGRHGGSVTLGDHAPRGLEAVIVLPAAPRPGGDAPRQAS